MSDWHIDWAAVATFAAAAVALFVGVLPNVSAARREDRERKRVGLLVSMLCLPALQAVEKAAFPGSHDRFSTNDMAAAMLSMDKAKRELERFDFVWQKMSLRQVNALLAIEEVFFLITGHFQTYCGSDNDGHGMRLAMHWETLVVPDVVELRRLVESMTVMN